MFSLFAIPKLGRCAWLFTLALFVAGCGAVATRQPLYDPERDTRYDARLVGTWRADCSDIEIRRSQRIVYLMQDPLSRTTSDSTSPTEFELVRLGKYQYLFVSTHHGDFGTLLFPCYRVEFARWGREMRLRWLNTVKIGKYLEDHPGTLKYDLLPTQFTHLPPTTSPASQSRPAETQPDLKNMILTDEPAKIRQFLIDHQDDPDWVTQPMVLRRQ
jgi:hypothetical protein